MKRITLFLVAVCTTALVACGGGSSNSDNTSVNETATINEASTVNKTSTTNKNTDYQTIIDLFDNAIKEIASIESIEALQTFEGEINKKVHEITNAIIEKGGEPTEAETEQILTITDKYTEAIEIKAIELCD